MDIEAAQELTLQSVLEEIEHALEDKTRTFASLLALFEGLTVNFGGVPGVVSVDRQGTITMLLSTSG